MTDKPKPWFRLKLRDDADLPRNDSMLSKAEVEVMPDQKWLRSEFIVYGASPMIVDLAKGD